MNINKLRNYWPGTCNDQLAAIDHMGVASALELGLITKEESNAITDAFVMNLTIAMETKRHASAAELHPIPNSEIVRRFRKRMGQEKAIPGCE